MTWKFVIINTIEEVQGHHLYEGWEEESETSHTELCG